MPHNHYRPSYLSQRPDLDYVFVHEKSPGRCDCRRLMVEGLYLSPEDRQACKDALIENLDWAKRKSLIAESLKDVKWEHHDLELNLNTMQGQER